MDDLATNGEIEGALVKVGVRWRVHEPSLKGVAEASRTVAGVVSVEVFAARAEVTLEVFPGAGLGRTDGRDAGAAGGRGVLHGQAEYVHEGEDGSPLRSEAAQRRDQARALQLPEEQVQAACVALHERVRQVDGDRRVSAEDVVELGEAIDARRLLGGDEMGDQCR